MLNISEQQLGALMSHNPAASTWVPALNAAMAEFDIAANADRVAAFLAQIAHESGELRRLVESLKYTTAKGICATWPNRFPTEADAAPYVSTAGVANGRDRDLANRVYGGRLGNGDIASGDGWQFRGRGLIQVTGRGNYKTAGDALGMDLIGNPDLLLQQIPAARSAANFWRSHGLNELADDRSDDDDDTDFVTITVRINGGKKGLTERRAYWAQARSILGL